MLMLDPYYRTFDGFCVLVQKEWCSFGHKFSCRLGSNDPKLAEERSPVFQLWLDCVWQCLVQFPTVFEFNQDFLLALNDIALSGRVGTFLFDSEKERVERIMSDVDRDRAHERGAKNPRTACAWAILREAAHLRNPLFTPLDAPIFPQCSSKALRLWEGFFFRYDRTAVVSFPLPLLGTTGSPRGPVALPNFV